MFLLRSSRKYANLIKVSFTNGLSDMRHAVVTSRSAALRALFPWAFSVQKILHAVRRGPFLGKHLFIGSDYGGDHKGSNYNTYAFLLVDDRPLQWLSTQRRLRAAYFTDTRRMSFKRLGDPQRQAALVPFLQAAHDLPGHLVVFVVHKSIRLHPTRKNDPDSAWDMFNLSANWKRLSLVDAIRKAHFFALLVSQWSSPFMGVTWISDEDEFVANDKRLDDAQQIAARLSSLYLPHTLREFAMNTTKVDGPGLELEDLVAVADLTAGMLAELSSALAKGTSWSDLNGRHALQMETLQSKSELIADWFWHSDATLVRTCIVIDKVDARSRVFKLDMLDANI
jgi:hypothetical protein